MKYVIEFKEEPMEIKGSNGMSEYYPCINIPGLFLPQEDLDELTPYAIPQKEYTEQQIRDTFNCGFSCGMDKCWIDINEECPTDSMELIATVYWEEYGDTRIACGHYNARFDSWDLYSDMEGRLYKGFRVIAWMPLPEPYGGEQE